MVVCSTTQLTFTFLQPKASVMFQARTYFLCDDIGSLFTFAPCVGGSLLLPSCVIVSLHFLFYLEGPPVCKCLVKVSLPALPAFPTLLMTWCSSPALAVPPSSLLPELSLILKCLFNMFGFLGSPISLCPFLENLSILDCLNYFYFCQQVWTSEIRRQSNETGLVI